MGMAPRDDGLRAVTIHTPVQIEDETATFSGSECVTATTASVYGLKAHSYTSSCLRPRGDEWFPCMQIALP